MARKNPVSTLFAVTAVAVALAAPLACQAQTRMESAQKTTRIKVRVLMDCSAVLLSNNKRRYEAGDCASAPGSVAGAGAGGNTSR